MVEWEYVVRRRTTGLYYMSTRIEVLDTLFEKDILGVGAPTALMISTKFKGRLRILRAKGLSGLI